MKPAICISAVAALTVTAIVAITATLPDEESARMGR